MRRYNFILTKENAHILINRLYKMLERYGAIRTYSKYNGVKNGAYILNSIGVKHDVLMVISTVPNFIHIDNRGDFEWHWEEMGGGDELIFNSDSSLAFSFPLGSKMYLTDSKICFISRTRGYFGDNGRGITEVFEPFSNHRYAKDTILFNEAMSDEYWGECEREYKKYFEEVVD